MPLTHKPATESAKPFGNYPELPDLDEDEKKVPELVSYHAKLKQWWYDVRRVLLRERDEFQ